ncbi:MAG: glycogen synthase GlgA [Bradyrhizobium sp.]|uniref:glycogen synthase GlgA n=1 Tax=Bradyrhizobium sp. TaxID=376 RepID=UPI0029A88B2C|nr:glycogen synthase GlgA [Bradyrhizobium sp.]MDX3966902.1 glycogen synthase GlgA [Bradyrhizobium sp.]
MPIRGVAMGCTDSFSDSIPIPEKNGCRARETVKCAPAALERKDRDDIRVLFASPEVFPLAKTGGLADVSAALPAALSEVGVDVRVAMPGYTEALDLADGKQKAVPLGNILGLGEAAVIAARTPDTGIPLWLVDCPALFRRPGGLYGDTEGRDWPDNALRFALFSHVVARLALGKAGANWRPHVAHVNDWHLGLVPALLAAQPGPHPRTILTIHNLAFQGVFPAEIFPRLGLPSEWLTADGVEFYGQVSFLKAGIRFADRLTTVSPNYAQEILTPAFGCGLDGLLRARAGDLVGILNGVDYKSWAPDSPTARHFPYSACDLSGKRRCKADLQDELGFGVDADTPLIAFVSRLTHQKMADVLPEIAPAIAGRGAQLAICGEGDRSIEQALRALEAAYPRQVAVRIGYEEALARRILAGADILVAPARFEPCGLTQMYAMRYGTIPVVRRIGGLADTVVGQGRGEDSPKRKGTGFTFDAPTSGDLAGAVECALDLYRQPAAWRGMQRRAMRQDFRWMRSAQRYQALYAELVQNVGDDKPWNQSQPTPLELRPTGT